jgi:PAS domain S-box-containing protein
MPLQFTQAVRQLDPASALQSDSEEFLRLAIRVAGIGMLDTDLKRRRSRFSPELCEILGLPESMEMPYEAAMRLIDERDRARVEASVAAAADATENGNWRAVCRVLRSDGQIRWVSMWGRRFYQLTAYGREPVRSIAAIIDITHINKEVADALDESKDRLRFALEAAQMGTFEADISASQAIIDRQEARILGLPDDTRLVPTEELRKRIPLEDLHSNDTKKQRMTDHGEAYHHEFRLKMPDGSERWISGHANIKSNRIFGVNLDITERKLAEEQLREREARLRIATDGAALGIFEWDPDGDHAVWENRRMYEIFGRDRADVALSKKQFVESYIHPDDGPDFEHALQRARKQDGNFHRICRFRREDGTPGWLQIDGKFHARTEGSSPRLVGVIADITERKRLERESKQLAECLITVQEEERECIAQELHDTTAQHLAAVSLILMGLKPQAGLSADAIERWEQVETCLNEALQELRAFSYLMHPIGLEKDGLVSTLRLFAAGYEQRSGVRVELRLSSDLDALPSEMQRTLLRIVQEALSNVRRHAKATIAKLAIKIVGNVVHLVVTDNGHGKRAESRVGRGIPGMMMRVQHYGGEFRTRSGREGTTVHATLRIANGGITIPLNMGGSFKDALTTVYRLRIASEDVKNTIRQMRQDLNRPWFAKS